MTSLDVLGLKDLSFLENVKTNCSKFHLVKTFYLLVTDNTIL